MSRILKTAAPIIVLIVIFLVVPLASAVMRAVPDRLTGRVRHLNPGEALWVQGDVQG